MSALTYKIITERLLIRCYHPGDAALLQKAIDESLEHLKPWMPWTTQEPESAAQKARRLEVFREEFERGIDFAFGIFSKDEQVLLGSTGLHTRIGPDAREIGYWIHAEYLRRGYALETVVALCKVGFEIEGLQHIEIHCASDNTRSQGIPSKLGFQLIRTEKSTDGDTYEMIWSLSKEAYLECAWKNVRLEAYDAKGVLINPGH